MQKEKKRRRSEKRKIAGNYLTSRSAKRIPTEARVAQKLSHKERYLQAEKEAARSEG